MNLSQQQLQQLLKEIQQSLNFAFATGTPKLPKTISALLPQAPTTQRYAVSKILGYGSYGVVVAAKDLWTGHTVAIKCFWNKVLQDATDACRVLKEIWLLGHFHGHDNIVTVLDIAPIVNVDSPAAFVVMEAMDTTLRSILDHCIFLRRQAEPSPLTAEVIQFYVYQLLCGVAYIHEAGVMHLDLKPENILVKLNNDLKITDFGLSRSLNATIDLAAVVCSRWYRPPEVILGQLPYTAAVDIWSVGAILAELYSLKFKPLFPGDCDENQLAVIFDVMGLPEQDDYTEMLLDSPLAQATLTLPIFTTKQEANVTTPSYSYLPQGPMIPTQLIAKMISFNPKKRLTAVEAMRDSYFKETCGSTTASQPLYHPDDESKGEPFSLDQRHHAEVFANLIAVTAELCNTVQQLRQELPIHAQCISSTTLMEDKEANEGDEAG